ncbi:MAG: hypothetical protein K9N34_07905 [Candidatus Marinimicrobia bacterium]|nr:hypothetical protein [Candidatus Neomarinimicrobiota bacterium]MCF7840535.1 hypothetical protein [Candidatus Neomarinimicrobiota bacterium]
MAVSKITTDQHKALGITLFNQTWDLIEKPDRTPDEEADMIHMAHASAFHWRQVGTELNFARSEWQISHVYGILERGEPAIYHAARCLKLCQENQIGDFDLAYAYEAVARAHWLLGSTKDAQHFLKQAEEAGKSIAKDGDKKQFFSDLTDLQKMIKG